MVREMSIEEVVVVYQGVRRCVTQGAPIKTPLFETGKRISEAIQTYETAKNIIAERYLKKDATGQFIPKTKEPVLVTDFESTDEKSLIKELNELAEKKIPIEFTMTSPNRPVLVTDKDGVSKEYSLSDYLELSGSTDIKVVAFLNQYFINE